MLIWKPGHPSCSAVPTPIHSATDLGLPRPSRPTAALRSSRRPRPREPAVHPQRPPGLSSVRALLTICSLSCGQRGLSANLLVSISTLKAFSPSPSAWAKAHPPALASGLLSPSRSPGSMHRTFWSSSTARAFPMCRALLLSLDLCKFCPLCPSCPNPPPLGDGPFCSSGHTLNVIFEKPTTL